MKGYTLKDTRIADMIEKHKLTFVQARRWIMKEDGFSFSQIAALEGVEKGTIQDSIELSDKKIKNPSIRNRLETETGRPIRVYNLIQKYENKMIDIEVYRGESVQSLGIDDEPTTEYSNQAIVRDYEVLTPTEWEERFVGESTGAVEIPTLVIVINKSGRPKT